MSLLYIAHSIFNFRVCIFSVQHLKSVSCFKTLNAPSIGKRPNCSKIFLIFSRSYIYIFTHSADNLPIQNRQQNSSTKFACHINNNKYAISRTVTLNNLKIANILLAYISIFIEIVISNHESVIYPEKTKLPKQTYNVLQIQTKF